MLMVLEVLLRRKQQFAPVVLTNATNELPTVKVNSNLTSKSRANVLSVFLC